MPKLLIVEDNPENSDSLSRRLQRRGFEVVIAADGSLGVLASLAEKPDLILMDVNMPVMSGWEATKRVKADPLTAHIPVIAVTAHALSGDAGLSTAAGCDAYHTKPVDFVKLLGQIEGLLVAPTGSPAGGSAAVPASGRGSAPPPRPPHP